MGTIRWVSSVTASTVLAIGMLVAVSSDAGAGAPHVNEPATATALEGPSPDLESAATAATSFVNVYWGWTIPTHPQHDERLAAGGRDVAAMTPATGAIEALLDGPNTTESDLGMGTSIPSGTELLGINIVGGVATIDLSSDFEGPGSSNTDLMRVTQVVFTLTQFDNVDRVKFHIDGVPTDPVTSHGIVVGDGLERDELEYFRPLILVEHPYPGAQVDDPLIVRGESNTFEANVRYVLTAGGGDGVIIDEGFTTATAWGPAGWGTFEISIDLASLPNYQSGPGAITVFESSPIDGQPVSVVEYPISLPALSAAGFARFIDPGPTGGGTVIRDYYFRTGWTNITDLDLDGDGTSELFYYNAGTG